jgi:hypothetical protein
MNMGWKWRVLGLSLIWSFFGLIAAGVLYEAGYVDVAMFTLLAVCVVVFWGSVASAIFIYGRK